MNDLEDAFCYDIDDLRAVVEANLKERQREAQRAQTLLEREVGKFAARLQQLEVVPTIVSLREKLEAIRRAELERALARLPGAAEETRAGHGRAQPGDREQGAARARWSSSRTRRAPGTAARWTEMISELFGLRGPGPGPVPNEHPPRHARQPARPGAVRAGRGRRCARTAPASRSVVIRTSGRPPRPGRPRGLRRQGALREGDRGGAARGAGRRGRAQPEGHARRAARTASSWPRSRPARTRATCCSRAAPGGWDGLPAGAVRRHVQPAAPGARAGAPAGPRGPSRSAATWTRASRSSRAGACDAIILAAAGLRRLGLAPAASAPCSRSMSSCPRWARGSWPSKPAKPTGNCLNFWARLDDTRSRSEAVAERAFLDRLGAGCHTPVAGHARARRLGADADRDRGEPGRRDGAPIAGDRRPPAGRAARGVRWRRSSWPRGRRRCSMRAAGDQVVTEVERWQAIDRAGGPGDPRPRAGRSASPSCSRPPGPGCSWCRPSRSSRPTPGRRSTRAARAATFAWVIFTSVNGVAHGAPARRATGPRARAPRARAGSPPSAPPPPPRSRGWGLRPTVVPDEYVAEGLVERLRPADRARRPRAAAARRRDARRAGARADRRSAPRVTEVPAYRTRARDRAGAPACARRWRRAASTSSRSPARPRCGTSPRSSARPSCRGCWPGRDGRLRSARSPRPPPPRYGLADRTIMPERVHDPGARPRHRRAHFASRARS